MITLWHHVDPQARCDVRTETIGQPVLQSCANFIRRGRRRRLRDGRDGRSQSNAERKAPGK